MIVLDCTLRDGRYYNNWVFLQNTVQVYVNKISNSSVKIVELAFRFKKKIIQFIKKFQPLVLSINYNSVIDKIYINCFCSCNIGRLMMDISDYVDVKKPLIFSKGLSSEKNKYLDELEIYNYEVSFKKNISKINESECILPDNLSFFYTIAVAVSTNYKNIFLTSLDGYTKDDFNFKNIQKQLDLFKKNHLNQKIFSLTPTNYNIKTKALQS